MILWVFFLLLYSYERKEKYTLSVIYSIYSREIINMISCFETVWTALPAKLILVLCVAWCCHLTKLCEFQATVQIIFSHSVKMNIVIGEKDPWTSLHFKRQSDIFNAGYLDEMNEKMEKSLKYHFYPLKIWKS